IADEVKRDRIKRLIDVVQHAAATRNAERAGGVEAVLVEGPRPNGRLLVEGASRTHPSLRRGRTRRNTTVNFTGAASAGELVDVRIDAATSTTLRGLQAVPVAARGP